MKKVKLEFEINQYELDELFGNTSEMAGFRVRDANSILNELTKKSNGVGLNSDMLNTEIRKIEMHLYEAKTMLKLSEEAMDKIVELSDE